MVRYSMVSYGMVQCFTFQLALFDYIGGPESHAVAERVCWCQHSQQKD